MTTNPLDKLSTSTLRKTKDEAVKVLAASDLTEDERFFNEIIVYTLQQELLMRHYQHPATEAGILKYGLITT